MWPPPLNGLRRRKKKKTNDGKKHTGIVISSELFAVSTRKCVFTMFHWCGKRSKCAVVKRETFSFKRQFTYCIDCTLHLWVRMYETAQSGLLFSTNITKGEFHTHKLWTHFWNYLLLTNQRRWEVWAASSESYLNVSYTSVQLVCSVCSSSLFTIMHKYGDTVNKQRVHTLSH